MCELVEMRAGGRYIKVAGIKKEYIQNIIESIHICSAIDKVVLFGSALEESCADHSDVDIAIFGKYTKHHIFRMKSYNEFVDAVVSFGELQDYDMLYFDSRKKYKDSIMKDIDKGVVLFERGGQVGIINETDKSRSFDGKKGRGQKSC